MAAPTFPPDRQRFRAVLAEIADKARTTLPECDGRVDAAVKLVLAGDVEYHPEDGSALVNSCADPTKVYHVKGQTCDCRDFAQAPKGLCKHRLSVMLTIRVQEILSAEAPQAGSLGIPRDPLPEAPSSCSVFLE